MSLCPTVRDDESVLYNPTEMTSVGGYRDWAAQLCSDVNKYWTHKDKDKDQTLKDQDKDKDLKLVLKE